MIITSPEPTTVNHFVYANDTVLLASSPSALQKLIDHYVKFAEGNDVIYNVNKTTCYVCQTQGHEKRVLSKDLYDHEIIVSEEKYVGAFKTDDCSDDDNVIRQMRSMYDRDNELILDI